ncbi:MAG: tRNA (cytidine(56)-2'-O)-methyltransferase [Thaumarchaeota archaeon]|nr:tRNA (cytidine(56)-2'-O)-methyltransferase [Nitrososphaerota archaeon]
MSRVAVLRIGYRLVRDDRITTHVALVARAFGADSIYTVGSEENLIEKIRALNNRWGGDFQVELTDDWRDIIKQWKTAAGLVVHLTMYGMDIGAVEEIRLKNKDVLVVVGAEKVPRRLYGLADYNIAVGHQPHSEVSALAVFLDRYFKGKELGKEFQDAKMKILPSAGGKNVIQL